MPHFFIELELPSAWREWKGKGWCRAALTTGCLLCPHRTPSCLLLLEQVTCQKEVFFLASSCHLTSQSALTRAVRGKGLLLLMFHVGSQQYISSLRPGAAPQGPGCFGERARSPRLETGVLTCASSVGRDAVG